MPARKPRPHYLAAARAAAKLIMRDADDDIETLARTVSAPAPPRMPKPPAALEPAKVKPAPPAPSAPADTDPDAAWATPAALSGLPRLMIEFAQVAGLEAAWRIFQERGGNRVYIPATAGDDHWLVRLAGREAADKISAHFAGDKGIELQLPRGPTGLKGYVHRRLGEMIAEGRSSPEITRELGISRDMVKDHRRKARERADGPQLDLLDLIARIEAEPAPAIPQLTKPAKRRT